MAPYWSPWTFVDLDIEGQLGATLHDNPPTIKKTGKSKTSINIFLHNIHTNQGVRKLLCQTQQLKMVANWTLQEYKFIEKTNQNFTIILLESEKVSLIPTLGRWSTELHNRNLIYQYWAKHLKSKQNGINFQQQLHTISDSLQPGSISGYVGSTIYRTAPTCQKRVKRRKERFLQTSSEILKPFKTHTG
jgi:hypothetical protein